MVQFAKARRGCILYAHMSTGKSKVALDVLEETGARIALIVCPKSVVEVWPGQFGDHAHEYWQLLLLGGFVRVVDTASGYTFAPARKVKTVREKAAALEMFLTDRRGDGQRGAVVVNYDIIHRGELATLLRFTKWDLVAFDEVHRIKAPWGKQSQAAGKIAATRRIGLTGTFTPHSPLDSWAQVRAVEPRCETLGLSYQAFQRRYAKMEPVPMSAERVRQLRIAGKKRPERPVAPQNQDELARKLAPVVLRVGPEVLDLPEAVHRVVPVQLSTTAQRAHDRLMAGMAADVGSGEVTAKNSLGYMMRASQITGGNVPVDRVPTRVDSSKADALRDLLEDLPPDEPVVVFCRFVEDLERCLVTSLDCDRVAFELSGRDDTLAGWQSRGRDGAFGDVLVVQIQAGSVGIDLTRAANVVFYSVDFNLGNFEQAVARTVRTNQTRTVYFHHLIARGTMDEIIYRALDKKRNVAESVVDAIRRYSTEGVL